MKKLQKIYYQRNKDYLFVDGYNIINYWEDLRKLSVINLEDTRNKLIDIMSEYATFTGEKVILVFDGYMVKKSPGAIYEINGIIVVFTKEFETADHFIERQLHEIGRVRKVRVATSDNVEQQIILSRGGIRISARELEMEVNIVKNNIQRRTSELKKASKKDINPINSDLMVKLEDLKKKL